MVNMQSKLIGKKVHITDQQSQYYREWGIVKAYDGEYYHVAIANGTDSLPMFNRDQFRVRRG